MSLDLFGSTIAAADQNVMANAAPDLPAGFGEAFDVAWRSGTEFHNSAAYSIAQANALSEYRDNIRQKTGEALPTLGMHSEANELNDYVSLDDFNAAQAKLKEKYPGLDYLTPLSEGDLNAMTLSRMKRAHDGAAAFANRETTWGGTGGTVLGSLAGGLTDPVMVATLPLGGAGEAGIALRALEFAAISGGTEAASAAINYRSREAAVPGSSKDVPGEVAAATVFGGVLGAGFGALAKLLGHGAKPLPTSVRDEVNAATSEFQFHATNPFPSAAGEAAARDATVEATTSLVKGETVRAADNFDAVHVADYALAAGAATIEPVKDGYVRFYHGGTDPASGGPRWLTPQEDYARNFRSSGPNDQNEVHYVDIPKKALQTDPALASGYDDVNSFGNQHYYRNFEAPEGIAKQLKPLGKAATPEELAIAGERHLRPETFGEVPDVERFDHMPGETEDAASYWDRRVAEASPEERAALGATDNANPSTQMDLLHGYSDGAGFSGFRPLDQVSDQVRYDGGNGVFGKQTYLDATGKWINGDNGPLGIDAAVRVKASFNKLFVLTPENVAELENIIGIDAIRSGPAIAEALKAKGYDGIHVHGFDDATSSAVSGPWAADSRIDPSVLQDQVVSFAPDKNLKVVGDVNLPKRPTDASPKQAEAYFKQRKAVVDAEFARPEIAARDLTPEQLQQLAADPATESAVLHNLEHIMLEKPDMEFSTQVRQADGSYQLTTQKLSDVLAELDGMEAAGKELEACAAGLAMAAE